MAACTCLREINIFCQQGNTNWEKDPVARDAFVLRMERSWDHSGEMYDALHLWTDAVHVAAWKGCD